MRRRLELQPERAVEQTEYGFAEGLQLIIDKIGALLKTQDYVVVAIAGLLVNDTNMGKTFLAGQLSQKLTELSIPCVVTSNDEALSKRESINMDRGVVILGAMVSPSTLTQSVVTQFSTLQDTKVERAGSATGLPLSHIDIHVLIYKPGRSVSEADRMYNDVVIRNVQATDKVSLQLTS